MKMLFTVLLRMPLQVLQWELVTCLPLMFPQVIGGDEINPATESSSSKKPEVTSFDLITI